MKSLFNEYMSSNTVAAEIGGKTRHVLAPIMQEYLDKGFNIREVCHIVLSEAFLLEAEMAIKLAFEKRRLEQHCTICNKNGHTRLHCPDQMKIGETK